MSYICSRTTLIAVLKCQSHYGIVKQRTRRTRTRLIQQKVILSGDIFGIFFFGPLKQFRKFQMAHTAILTNIFFFSLLVQFTTSSPIYKCMPLDIDRVCKIQLITRYIEIQYYCKVLGEIYCYSFIGLTQIFRI